MELIIRNKVVSGGLHLVIFCEGEPAIDADKLWCAAQVAQPCAYKPINRNTYLRAHPDPLAEVLPPETSQEEVLQRAWRPVVGGLKCTQEALSSPGLKRAHRAHLSDRCTNLRCMLKLLQ